MRETADDQMERASSSAAVSLGENADHRAMNTYKYHRDHLSGSVIFSS